MLKLFSLVCFILAAVVAKLMWGNLLTYILAQIPVGVSWAFWAKLASIAFVGWFGGVGLPIFFIILGIYILITDLAS